MTLREATEIAMRESGFSEDEIKLRIDYADNNVPDVADAVIHAGQERHVIDMIKVLNRQYSDRANAQNN